jgi:hypothetical protein
VIGLNMLALWDDRGTPRPWTEPLERAMSDGVVEPVVHAAVPFAKAGEAHHILAARENVGNAVLVPSSRRGPVRAASGRVRRRPAVRVPAPVELSEASVVGQQGLSIERQ